jgi:hypothetical protein
MGLALRKAQEDFTESYLLTEGLKLERELNAAQARIKRLEESGDALCENLAPSRWDLPAAAAQKLVDQSNWRKAKDSQ